MCFGIPMQIKRIDQFIAHCEAKGVEREVSLFMMQHETWAVGDYLVSHLGQAIQKVSREEAESAWALYDEMHQNAMQNRPVNGHNPIKDNNHSSSILPENRKK